MPSPYWLVINLIFLQVYKCSPIDNHLDNGELMNICEDFSRFIMKEIIHFHRKYFDPELELALVDVARIELNHEDY
jgi:hypothetical protein